MALAKELTETAQELGEVKAALRCGGSFLGMSGSLLQSYAVEVAKKENLLRLALSHLHMVSGAGARRRAARAASAPPSWATILEPSPSKSPGQRQSGGALSEPEAEAGVDESPTPEASLSTPLREDPALAQAAPAGRSQAPAPATFAAPPAHPAQAREAEADKGEEEAQARLRQLDKCSVAEAIQLMERYPGSEHVQRTGLHALGRLAQNAAQLRPLCVAATAAVISAASRFRGSCAVQRLAMSSMGNIAYVPVVAALILRDATPVVLQAMVAHPTDAKVRSLACEALARLSQSGARPVVASLLEATLSHAEASAVDACVAALAPLLDSGICQPRDILDAVTPIAEDRPCDLEAQRRVASALRALVAQGALEAAASASAASPAVRPLLGGQWPHLLSRFLGAEFEEAQLNGCFHTEVQALFHEEVVRHFEYEAAERSAQLLARGAPGARRLREVVRCLVENLEDYRSRMAARESAWDSSMGRLVPLDAGLRRRLLEEATSAMERGLDASLRAAAAGDEAALAARTARLRAECGALLDRKTELTQIHQERATELRREVMLFEAVEYLELQVLRGEAGAAQVRSALHMFEVAAPEAPPDAVERLEERLHALAARMSISPPPRAAGVAAGVAAASAASAVSLAVSSSRGA